MPKTTEELLDEYNKIAYMSVTQNAPRYADKDRPPELLDSNQSCAIFGVSDNQKKQVPFEHIARIAYPEWVRLLGEKKLANITSLLLSNTTLTSLPTEIKQLVNLTSLNLYANYLTNLPTEIGKLINLTKLELHSNQVDSLPAEIGQLTNLTKLNFYNNKLTSLPPEIGQLTNLSFLELENNQLTNLPPEIGQLVNLNSFDLGHNQLTSLPTEIGQLAKLTNLALSGNRLTSLPTEIGQLTSLTSLDLSNNRLTSLPAEIGLLTSLTSLDLSSNRLTSLPAEIGLLTNLTSLTLSGNKLTSLPSEIRQLTNLTSLNLSRNELTKLPPEIGKLSNLTSLALGFNQLTSLPPEIGLLSYLTSLALSENQLTSLPSEIGQLINLTSFALGYNRLTSLPPEIGQLTNLSWLDLGFNRLTSLPPQIGQLTNLTSFDLVGNQLTTLSPEIGLLTNLTTLDLSKNQLISTPTELVNLKALKTLNLFGNLLNIPPEILDQVNNPQAILNYFAWVHNGKRKPVAETKMLVVGQGSVGKTSLIKRLLRDTFDPQENKTDGIAINRWMVESSSERNNQQSEIENRKSVINVNIWDFGGQEIMHATHQFFLTKRSLYLLVLDARLTQEENRVEYWLKIIQSFGGESPVLLVGNKIDQHPLDIDRYGLQKKYPNLLGIFEVSAATGAGITELETVIATQVNNLPHINDALPETWFNVKTALETLGCASDFITQDKYNEVCTSHSVSDELSQHTLIGFLHDLGVVLHFQDDPRLEALGILNPQWVTNGVYKILNAETLFHNQGVLTMPMLNDILNLPGYPRDKRLFLVDMMKKFELCYNLPAEHTFLIPDLLPKDQPQFSFDSIPAFVYTYPVLPSSVMTRFIVRMNQKISTGIVWRSGVLLQIGGNQALIQADFEDRKLTISIAGTEHTRRDALTAIRYELDEIHASIKGLNPQRMVPIPSAPQAEPVKYELLLRLELAGNETYPVIDDTGLVTINVRQVLSGVADESQRKQDAANIVNNFWNVNTGGGDFTGHDKHLTAHENATLIGENFTGNLTQGDHNQVIAGQYNKIVASNAAAELKQTLQELTQAVRVMVATLADEHAEEILEDLSKLIDETIKPKPNPKWYTISIEGLIKAAENLDRLGEPVINLARKVLSLLSGAG